MSGRWYLIANPAAGCGRARRLAPAAARVLAAAGCALEVRYTEKTGDAGALAAEGITAEAERIVVLGGDGTVREVLSVLAGKRVPLGLLPAGRANDLARALGIPTRPKPALEALLHGRVRAIDLGQVGDQLFATVATFGLDAAVSQAVSAHRRPLLGSAAYLLAMLRRLPGFQCPEVHLTGDFGEYRGRVLLVATGNTATYGGGLRITPGAEPADGWFEVCVVGPVPATTVLAMVPRLYWGGHVRHPQVRLLCTRSLHIETTTPHPICADGDWLGQTPATLCVLPHALHVIVPGPQPARPLQATALAWLRAARLRLRVTSLPGTPLCGIFR